MQTRRHRAVRAPPLHQAVDFFWNGGRRPAADAAQRELTEIVNEARQKRDAVLSFAGGGGGGGSGSGGGGVGHQSTAERHLELKYARLKQQYEVSERVFDRASTAAAVGLVSLPLCAGLFFLLRRNRALFSLLCVYYYYRK